MPAAQCHLYDRDASVVHFWRQVALSGLMTPEYGNVRFRCELNRGAQARVGHERPDVRLLSGCSAMRSFREAA